MPEFISDAEFSKIIAQDPSRRYAVFLDDIIEIKVVWGLKTADGWVMAGDRAGKMYFPVWPRKRYAEVCAGNEWVGAQAEPISLDDWTKKWIPGLSKDGYGVAVFSTPESNGLKVTPRKLQQDTRMLCDNMVLVNSPSKHREEASKELQVKTLSKADKSISRKRNF